jgi:sulfur carrier protein
VWRVLPPGRGLYLEGEAFQNRTVSATEGSEINWVIANGERVSVTFPSTLEAFLRARSLLPRSVVVELNGEAIAPSEFAGRRLAAGDRLEIVRIVAGG